jgi:hypothetical protein
MGRPEDRAGIRAIGEWLMARLFRPHIPLSVRVQVAMKGLLSRGVNPFEHSRRDGESLTAMLGRILKLLAGSIGCEVDDLRLDHDPALGARPKERRGLGRKTYYIPDANDPNHLFYRPHGPEFDGSHLIKTNVRGDHGQHPDRVLIKKQRRFERGPKPKRGPKMQSHGFERGKSRPFPKRSK